MPSKFRVSNSLISYLKSKETEREKKNEQPRATRGIRGDLFAFGV